MIKYIFITFDLYNLNTFSLFNLWNKSIQTEKEKKNWKKIRQIPLFILLDFELSFFSMAAFLCVCLSAFSFCYGSYSRVVEEHYQASSNNLNLKNRCIFLRYFMCNNFQTLHYFCKELHLRSHRVPPNGHRRLKKVTTSYDQTRHSQNVWQKTFYLRCLEDSRFTTSWRPLIYDVLKMSDLQPLEHVGFSWGRLFYDVLKTSYLRHRKDVCRTTPV